MLQGFVQNSKSAALHLTLDLDTAVSVVLWPGVRLGFLIFTKVVLEIGSESFGSLLFHGELCGHHSECDSMALLCSLWVDFSRILHSTLLNNLPQRSQDVPGL